MGRIEVAAAAEGVIALISAAGTANEKAQTMVPQQLGRHLADRASADPSVSQTLMVASSIIASQSRGPSITTLGTKLTEAYATDDLPLFAYEDRDDGTIRFLC